ncbi:hypothetical protein ABZV92_19975 [Streptomyces rubiginosohelvolus]|uniref:hypothetical protein n=1 Tax=Streptomyces rubiginosohelvolus TaxID=67362 RepID=UPI0033B3777C
MPFHQINPNPACDPGFRLDLDGRARFLHEGFTVDVQVRPATREDMPLIVAEVSSFAVMMIGTVTMEGAVLCEVSEAANEREPARMREALESVLSRAVEESRRAVRNMVLRIEEIDREQRRSTAV